MADISTIILFFVALGGFLFIVRDKTQGRTEQRAVIALIAVACLLRITLVLLYGSICNNRGTPDMISDGAVFTSYGIVIAEFMTGKVLYSYPAVTVLANYFKGTIPHLGAHTSYQISVLMYLQGTFYSLLGYSVFFMKFLNSLFALIGGFLIYYFTRERIGSKTSVVAMALVLFFPSILLWSVTSLKEPFIITGTFLIVLLLVKFIQKPLTWKGVGFFVCAFITAALLNTTRERLVYLYVATLFISFILLWIAVKPIKRSFIAAVLFIGISAGFLAMPGHGSYVNKGLAWTIKYQAGQSKELSNTFYKIYPERFYKTDDIKSMLDSNPMSLREWIYAFTKGTAYFAFSPFPFDFKKSAILKLVFIQSLINIILFPFMIFGIFYALKLDRKFFVPFAVFLVLYWIIAGMGSGNIGTAFRHRDVMMLIYILFSAIGICRLIRK